VTSCDCWYHRHASVWITHVESLHCFGPLSIPVYSLTFNFDFHQFLLCSPVLLSPHYHIHSILTTSITIMSDNCHCSPSPSACHSMQMNPLTSPCPTRTGLVVALTRGGHHVRPPLIVLIPLLIERWWSAQGRSSLEEGRRSCR